VDRRCAHGARGVLVGVDCAGDGDMKERFSKALFGAWVAQRMRYLETCEGFRRGDGWGKYDKRKSDINRAFGEYSALRTIQDAFDLPDGNK